jgi:hypothetical protein
MALPTISDITDAAVREASRSLAAERGTLRVLAQRSGPGTAPKAAPKPLVAPTTPPAPPASAVPPKGWDANKPSSMAAMDRRSGRTPR